VCVWRLDSLLRSSLHAALWARYGIGDDDLFHQVTIGLEADRLPGFCGEWIQLSGKEKISSVFNVADITQRKKKI